MANVVSHAGTAIVFFFKSSVAGAMAVGPKELWPALKIDPPESRSGGSNELNGDKQSGSILTRWSYRRVTLVLFWAVTID